ncbi:hypothetical protein ASZ78_007254 [Callipepla squamata]|uniref:C2H2-type domain-containing protein n=1 Tax=Callipepla squamata TaxID=9009 RepID=A0A226MNP6_CALSU|nr:hypothetical protein ASZ78_007254 [Callipepla squamata]
MAAPEEGGSEAPPRPPSPCVQAEERPPSPSRHGAAPLAPAELRRVIERQLEAICVQVQPGQMKETERPMPSLAPIQPKAVTLSQSVGSNSSVPGLGVINPQIIKIQPVTGPEQQQQLFLRSSSEPPIQLLMQRPLPSHGAVNKTPASKVLNRQKTARATASPARSLNTATAGSANTVIPCLEKRQKDDKLKKPLKVKTRSGRISRPPKYKAKDYKFIKMEDLADSHQSDSDDYSELSIEDDEEGKVKGKDALFNSSNYNLKPKMFKCQTCEKSYIGKGGLARHYKLNPDHGQLESVPQKTPSNKPNGSIFVDSLSGTAEENRSSVHLNSVAVTLNNENALPTNLEGTAGSQVEQLIQQCDKEDLMELALPRLTELVTVYEFLLMKVEKGCPAKAYFPDVYREFEELHNMVKKMAYDYLSNSDFLSCQQPVEIKDAKVAESLGITETIAGEQKMQGVDSCPQRAIKMISEQVPVETPGQKRFAESSGEELLPSAKRTKLEDVMENVNNAYSSQDEVKEKSGNLCTLFEKDGLNPLNGEILLSEDRCITCCTTGSVLPAEEEHNLLADSEVRISAENSGTFSQTVEMRIEYSQPVDRQGQGISADTSLLHTEVVLPEEAGSSPGLAEAHLVNQNTAGGLSAPELCSPVSEHAACAQSTSLSVSEENGLSEKHHTPQEEKQNLSMKGQSEQLHGAGVTETQEMEKAFSTHVPVNYPHGAQAELHQNPVQEASLSAAVSRDCAYNNVSEFSCGTEEHQENTVTVDQTVAFEITDESHDFLTQGHEQIFIQTSDGLILSHPDAAVLSQAEGIVIVTASDGTTMHIRTPDGIPLETVEALLAMEADGQSEDVLLSQSELEP